MDRPEDGATDVRTREIPPDAGIGELVRAYLAGIPVQFRALGGTFALFLLPYLLVLACVLYVRFTTEIDVRSLMRDPLSWLEAPFYIGIVSNIGVLSWTPGVSIGFFVAWILRGRPDQAEWRFFLTATSALGAFLLFDDFFQFHEDILKSWIFENGPFGMGDGPVLGTYGLLTIWVAWRSRRLVLQTEYALLACAIALLALSVAIDVGIINRPIIPDTGVRAVVEDGAKMTGIATWSLFQVRLGLARLRAVGIAPASERV